MAYIESTKIKVFPTNHRKKEYNPSSWKTTEENFRKLLTIANTTKDFVKGDDNDLIIVMKGYIFIVAKSDVVSTASQSDTVIYASIVTTDVELNPGATDSEATSILGDGSTLDEPNNSSVDEFTGIFFSNTSSEGSLLVLQKDSSDEWIIPETSKCVIKSDVIYNEVGTEKKAISEEFAPKKISTPNLDALAINAQNVEVATKVTSPEFDSEQTLVVGTESTDVFKGTATRAINDSKGYKLDATTIADIENITYDSTVGRLVFRSTANNNETQVTLSSVPMAKEAEVAQSALKVESGTSNRGYVLIKPYGSSESHAVNYVPSMEVQQANGKCVITNAVVGYASKLTKVSGSLETQTYSVGNSIKPVYFSDGVPVECSIYAGGTAITLNGSGKGSNTASFYAPTSYGTSYEFLVGGGSSSSPVWSDAINRYIDVNFGSASSSCNYILGANTNGTDSYNSYSYDKSYNTTSNYDLGEKRVTGRVFKIGKLKICALCFPCGVNKDNYWTRFDVYQLCGLSSVYSVQVTSRDYHCQDANTDFIAYNSGYYVYVGAKSDGGKNKGFYLTIIGE